MSTIITIRHGKLIHNISARAAQEVSVDLLESLQSVVTLDVSNNKLSELADEVSCLQRLQRLDLRNNDLAV